MRIIRIIDPKQLGFGCAHFETTGPEATSLQAALAAANLKGRLLPGESSKGRSPEWLAANRYDAVFIFDIDELDGVNRILKETVGLVIDPAEMVRIGTDADGDLRPEPAVLHATMRPSCNAKGDQACWRLTCWSSRASEAECIALPFHAKPLAEALVAALDERIGDPSLTGPLPIPTPRPCDDVWDDVVGIADTVYAFEYRDPSGDHVQVLVDADAPWVARRIAGILPTLTTNIAVNADAPTP